MTAEEYLYDIIGDLADGNVYPLHAYQAGSFPYIVYSRASTSPITGLCGDYGSGFARMQVDIVSNTYESARSLASQVRSACSSYKGILIQNQNDISEPERNIYRIVQDYSIFEED